MFRGWLQALGIAALAVVLLGAPCRDCFPRDEAPAKAPCGHDCCPKPKPAKGSSKPCAWQPAGFDALETAKQKVEPELVAFVLAAPGTAAIAIDSMADAVRASWHAPPSAVSAPRISPLRL